MLIQKLFLRVRSIRCRFLLFAPPDAHTVPAARARGLLFDAISLPRRKEMAKEKTPRRSLLELP